MQNNTRERLLSILSKDHPEVCEILSKEGASIDDLVSFLSENPEKALDISGKIMSDEGFLTFMEDQREDKEHQSFDMTSYRSIDDLDESMILDDAGNLNPIYDALLAERLQFDGDAPELRFGNVSSKVTPAVPVLSSTGNMFALGMQLEEASEEARNELIECENETRKLREKIEDGDEELALIKGSEDLPIVLPKKYTHGRIAPVRKEIPSGSCLLALSDSDRKRYTWKALSTTQGRVSACSYISSFIESELNIRGIKLKSRKLSESRSRSFDWTMNMHGEGATQSRFPFLQVASKSLLAKLEKHLKGKKGTFLYYVKPINNISDREIGWEVLVKRS